MFYCVIFCSRLCRRGVSDWPSRLELNGPTTALSAHYLADSARGPGEPSVSERFNEAPWGRNWKDSAWPGPTVRVHHSLQGGGGRTALSSGATATEDFIPESIEDDDLSRVLPG